MSNSSEEVRVGMHITSDPDETTVDQPDAHDADERISFPLRLVFASDLIPQAGTSGEEDDSARLVRVNKHDFADLMRQFHPRLSIEVPGASKGGDDPQPVDVELAFPSLEDFHPEQLARQTPATRRLLTLRTMVARARDGEIDLKTFQAEMQEAGLEDDEQAAEIYRALSASADSEDAGSSAAPPSGEGQSLDRLMGMVDGGQVDSEQPSSPADTAPASSPLAALMQAVTESSDEGPKADADVASRLLRRLDDALSERVGALLNHPKVRRLESAWRELNFLTDRINFRADIQLEVLPVSKDDLNSALYHQVLMPEHESDVDKPPLSAVMLHHEFDNSKEDVEQLQDLAEIGASMQTPLIGSASTDFFGIEKMAGLLRFPPLRQHLDGPDYIEWNKLRDDEAAKFLTLALPPFALRSSYGRDRPVEAFDFDEEEVLWGSPSVAVAALMADSFADTGWPTHLRGRRLEGLPLHTGPAAKTALSALLPDRKQQELADAGFLVCAGQPNQDAAYLTHAPTIAQPDAQEGAAAQAEARAHVSLPCQLFVARAAAALLRVEEALEPGCPVDQAQEQVEQRMQAFLQTDGDALDDDAVSVEYVEEASGPEAELLAVRMHPPSAVLAVDVSLVMGVQVAAGNEAA